MATHYLGAASHFSSVQKFHSGRVVSAIPLLTIAQVNCRLHTVVIVHFCVKLFSGLRITPMQNQTGCAGILVILLFRRFLVPILCSSLAMQTEIVYCSAQPF
jgi:hypothetical protein